MDPRVAQAIHQINGQSYNLNKSIIQKSATMQDIPLQKSIYEQQPQPAPEPVPAPEPIPAPVVEQPQVVQQVVQQDLTPLIDRVTALEKQVTKFVNLIERNVAKNAKEINIRIKLNENNDSTNK